MPRTTVSLPSDLIQAIDLVRSERRDEKRSVTTRVLLREALVARGVLRKKEELAHDCDKNPEKMGKA